MKNNLTTLNKLEKYSLGLINQEADWFKGTKDIVWYANEVSDFSDENITDYYKNNSYGKETRWDMWSNCLKSFEKHKIKSVLDIGCANGHLIFLAQNKNINAYGIEPRKNIVDKFQNKFREKSLFVSNYECFIEFLINHPSKFKFDCICATNYMHGEGHNPVYLKMFFENIFNYCNYLLTSEPNWQNYGLDNLLIKAKRVECIAPTNLHFLFKKEEL